MASVEEIKISKELKSAVTSGDLTAIKRVFENGANLNARIGSSTPIYLAIKAKNFDAVQLLLSLGAQVDDPVELTGSLRNYTALHLACSENDRDLTRLLVIEYDANVHAVADDTQPIALAALLGHVHIVRILLDNGANPDATISKSIYTKYVKDVMWCSDFGDKMTLLAFALLNKKKKLAELLLKYDVNVRVKSLTNKTLLMYAVKFYFNGKKIINSIRDKLSPEEINARDDRDFSVAHHLLCELLDIKDRLCIALDNYIYDMNNVLESLVSRGLDLDATINNNPNSFIVNFVASHHCPYFLIFMLDSCSSISESRALYNAIHSQALENRWSREHPLYYRRKRDKETTIRIIATNLLFRQHFHDPTVPKQEIELLDKVMKENTKLRLDLEEYKTNISDLNYDFIYWSDTRMSFYDFFKLTNKELEKLVRVENFTNALSTKKLSRSYPGIFFTDKIKTRIRQAEKRVKLLNQCKKMHFSTTSCFSQVPYEIILEVVEYLDVKELELFILAFQSYKL